MRAAVARRDARAGWRGARAADAAREKSLAAAQAEAVKKLTHLTLELERQRDAIAEAEAVRYLLRERVPRLCFGRRSRRRSRLHA